MTISVLLLEDNPDKKSKLLALLNGNKNLFGRIDTAITSSQAIDFMKNIQYDLFIADIVVPFELGGSKSEEHCIALFEQIDDKFDGILPPHYALPISTHSNLTKETHDFFRGRPWGIINYDETSSDCLITIEKIAAFVLSGKFEQKNCDIFLISALEDPEYTALEKLEIDWDSFEPFDPSQMIRFGQFKKDGRVVNVAAAFCSRIGPVPAAILVTKVISKIKPKYVIMSGICGGVKSKTSIGDVIAADLTWDWQSGKHIESDEENSFEISPHQIAISDSVSNELIRFKREGDFWKSFSQIALENKLENFPKLVIGPLASGSSVISDKRVAERIKTQQNKNVVGFDMESYGVYAAVRSCDPNVKFVSLKSVCDFADFYKNDKYQKYASTVSANAIFYFISFIADLT